MRWALLHLGWYGGHWYNLLSCAVADVLLLAVGAVATRLVAWHKKHAHHAAATHRIMADLYEHHTGSRHPAHPDGPAVAKRD